MVRYRRYMYICTLYMLKLGFTVWSESTTSGFVCLSQGCQAAEKEEKKNKWELLLRRVKTQVQRIKQEEHAIAVFGADGWRGSR
jgi:hypothetical protein